MASTPEHPGDVDPRAKEAWAHSHRHTTLFRSPAAWLGRFRCRPDDELWRTENWIGPYALVVFPGTPVWIRRHRERVCADESSVMLYNADQTYTRGVLSDVGDDCLTLHIRREMIEDADPDAPFGSVRIASTAPISARRAAIVDAARAGDTLAYDELAMELFDLCRGAPDSARALSGRRDAGPRAARVENALAFIATSPLVDITLRDVADAVNASPYHLAREVRRRTGHSIHGHRTRLRLELGLRRVLEDDTPLARLAVELGFADQAHFTNAFGARYGVTPGRVRREGSTILQDARRASA